MSVRSKKTSRPFQDSRQHILVMAHNHPAFFPGGAEMMAYDMFQEIQKMENYHVHFLAATDSTSRTAHEGTSLLGMEGTQNEYLFHNDAFSLLNQSNLALEVLNNEFADFLQTLRPDIIHMHHIMRFGVEAIRVIRTVLPQSKIVLTLHDFIPICHRDGQMVRTNDNELCERATPSRCHQCFPEISASHFKLREHFIKTHLQQVDAFVSPSHFLAERYRAWGLPPEKIHVIENGTKPTIPAPHRKIAYRHPRNQFAFFGNISHYKGIDVLLDAVNILIKRNITQFHVNIHGTISMQNDAYRQEFTSTIKALGDNITFHGGYQSAHLPTLMRENDWVVMPSIWWENAPLVIAEARHHQRPVLCSNIGGMAEHVTHEGSGLHFQVGSAASLADAMHRAISDPHLWHLLLNHITTPPSNRMCAEQYIKLYQQLN
jgi:glycosyltransferase involved in cell wall biosynthesis